MKTVIAAVPAMNEFENIESFINSFIKQNYSFKKLFICVNQPESYIENIDKQHIYENNQLTLIFLNGFENRNICVIDKSSKGKAWNEKDFGVGWARKIAMDKAVENANDADIIVCMDVDTEYPSDYFDSLIDIFENKNNVGLANPFYHRLTGNEDIDRSILRYEIYMRCYSLLLSKINSPYSYNAVGSAMATTVKTYKNVNGIAPKKSGEDFYFLQKLRKYGQIADNNSVCVFPAARLSDRVIFGTGPALIKGLQNDWKSYPMYHFSLFLKISELYQSFHTLFNENIPTVLDDFILAQFGITDIWTPLRKNFKTQQQFIKACHEKIDGLRILQFLKDSQPKLNISDEKSLNENMFFLFNNELQNITKEIELKSFDKIDIELLHNLRNNLFLKQYGNSLKKYIDILE